MSDILEEDRSIDVGVHEREVRFECAASRRLQCLERRLVVSVVHVHFGQMTLAAYVVL